MHGQVCMGSIAIGPPTFLPLATPLVGGLENAKKEILETIQSTVAPPRIVCWWTETIRYVVGMAI